ncbi:hypothetical protein LCGC14_1584030 [marine sediment metagenome]|uniref:Uncharacterized protein n=1 Tax=marine sediment metagenome TaxID=412755 RepID=A0A0F9J275_9ZZZZ
MKCAICGKPQKDDLFSYVTQQPACSICVIKCGLPSPISKGSIETARDKLGLKEGEYLKQDNGEEARRILNRTSRNLNRRMQ